MLSINVYKTFSKSPINSIGDFLILSRITDNAVRSSNRFRTIRCSRDNLNLNIMMQFIVNDENILANYSQTNGERTNKSSTDRRALKLTDKLPLKKYKETDMTISDIIQTDISYMIWVLDNTQLAFDNEVINAVGGTDEFIKQTKMF